jgi:hypothetical protein
MDGPENPHNTLASDVSAGDGLESLGTAAVRAPLNGPENPHNAAAGAGGNTATQPVTPGSPTAPGAPQNPAKPTKPPSP